MGISKVDCKDQFNHVKPNDTKQHFTTTTEWLTKRKRWCMSETVWFVHKECKRLDQAGRGNSTKFWFITHGDLRDTVEWEMHNNNFIVRAGRLGYRNGCIPKGVSFSTEAADFHNLWHIY